MALSPGRQGNTGLQLQLDTGGFFLLKVPIPTSHISIIRELLEMQILGSHLRYIVRNSGDGAHKSDLE